jgi:hypothetical protein
MFHDPRKEIGGRQIPLHRGEINAVPGQYSDRKYNPYKSGPVKSDDFHSRHPFNLKEEFRDFTNTGKARLAVTFGYLAVDLLFTPLFFLETPAAQSKLILAMAIIYLGSASSAGNLIFSKGTRKS